MATGHQRAQSAADDQEGSDADHGQADVEAEALPRGGGRSGRVHRAPSTVDDVQPAQPMGTPARGAQSTGAHLSPVVLEESREKKGQAMSSRDEILERVRRNQPAPRPLPPIPTFDAGLSTSIDTFKANLIRMGGKFVDAAADGDLETQIRKIFPEVKANRPIDGIRTPQALNDVDVGVVRALFGVAETGSLWLSEVQYKINALGFLAQHLVVLLDPGAIVANMHRAYQHRGFFEAKYAVFMTGPSATADIE